MIDRRRFLSTTALALSARFWPAGRQTTVPSVVLVVLGGGVRVADVFETGPDDGVFRRLLRDGAALLNVRAGGAAPAEALAAMLSGPEPSAPKGGPARPDRLLFDCVAGGNAWIVADASGPAGPALASLGLTPGTLRAHFVAVDHLVAPAVQSALRRFAPRIGDEAAESRAIAALLKRLAEPAPSGAGAPDPGTASLTLALQEFMLDQARKPAADDRPARSDRSVIAAATALVRAGPPPLLVVPLSDARVAERSHSEALAVLREIELALAPLVELVLGTAQTPSRATLVLATDVGRNRKPDKEGRLGRDDGSKDLEKAAIVFSGAGIKPGPPLRSTANATDLPATIAELLGIRDFGRGRPLRSVLA